MTTLERLEQKTYYNNIHLIDADLPIKGYYYSNVDYNFSSITINKCLNSTCERCCVLAEELGHHFTTPMNLFSACKTNQSKYEHCALAWAVNELVPLHRLVDGWKSGATDRWELAEYLDVTESFLHQALEIHRSKYGESTKYKNYIIRFNLLNIKRIA